MQDETVDVWATDEVHFQQHGSRCQMWIPPETKDPVLLHAPTRRSVGYFGAVRLRDGRFQFCRETGKFNGVTFFAFMKSLRRTSIRTGRRVVVITDNAKYHHALLHKPWREEHVNDFALCQGRSEREPLGRSKWGPVLVDQLVRTGVWGPAGAEPCEAVGRARAERKAAPKRWRDSGRGGYLARSAARRCLLVLSR